MSYSADYLPRVETNVHASSNPVAILNDGGSPKASISTTQEAGAKKVDYKRDIQPILTASCYACHVGEKAQAELRLDTKAGALKGGVSGPVIIAGNSKGSLLIQRVHGEGGRMMPPSGQLPKEQLGLLAAWIDEGAEWPEGETVASKNTPPAQSQTADGKAAGQTLDFEKDIQPILKASCYQCHTGGQPAAGLRLDAKTLAMKGGVSGPVIVPGNAQGSRLIHRVLGLNDEPRMPLNHP
ncbi:MAG: hypothetical protein H0T92_17105, partial [Pyrinomonadaceae bacterium]|nr:hypothetical protein [Pyrinomonadaceae bacterium]